MIEAGAQYYCVDSISLKAEVFVIKLSFIDDKVRAFSAQSLETA